MKILTLVLKDLRQMLSDKNSALFLVAMPIVFTLFMGFAFGSGENGEAEEQRIPLAWVEADPANEFSQILFEKLQETESFDISTMELEDAQQALQQGKINAILVIPDDFDQKVKVTDPTTLQSYYDTEKIKELISDEMKKSGGFLGFGGKSLESVIPGISKKVAEGDYTDEWVDAMVSKGAFDQESGAMFKGWRDYLNRMNMYYKGEKVYSEGLEKKLGTSQENNKPGWWNK